MAHRTAADALRTFEMMVTDGGEHNLAKFPSDFSLVELGEWLEDIGTLLPYDKTKILVNGADYLQKENPSKA